MRMIDTQNDMLRDESLNQKPEEPPMDSQAFVQSVTASMNLAAELEEGQLQDIATQVLDDYRLDKDSMGDWLTLMKRGIDLAAMVKTEKTYPFKNRSANVKYPLVTSAALQFNARAYPAIVPSDQVVRAQVFGVDADGSKAARGERISSHMSWQLTSQMEEWEEDTDSLLMQLPIVGTMFRKVWYDPIDRRPRCRLIEAGKLIINNKVKNLSDAPRCSEEIALYPTEIESRIRSGEFVQFAYDNSDQDKDAAQEFIEQHCRLDLDDDGYCEPYIVMVHKDSQTVVKVVADFDDADVTYITEVQQVPAVQPMTDQMGQPLIDGFGQPVMQQVMTQQEIVTGIKSIKRGGYFVCYRFMPAIDGGFYGIGLGLLLGDISDTINTIINMMLDAGHMASLGGGFIGSDFRMKGGNSRFEPGEWKLAQATGGEIKNSIVPMTFPGPDATLYQMLGMLIDAGREISSTKDIMTGDSGGRQQTATTTIALIEQGMMVFSASYKRIFRALRQEYRMLAKINAKTVTAEEYNAFHDAMGQDGQPIQLDPATDYSSADMDISPTADPRSVTKMQEMAKAQMLMQMADAGLVDKGAAAERILAAANISDLEALVPQPDPVQAQMGQFQAQMAMQMAQADLTQKMVDIDKTLMEIEQMGADIGKTMAETDAIPNRLRLDAMSELLKERRDEIEQTLRAGLRGMAGQPGNGGAAQGNPRTAGPADRGMQAGLLGGQAGIGGAALDAVGTF